MIDEIEISGIATFGDEAQKLNNLSRFNFLFGSNGSGKTTISRIIDDASSCVPCIVKWKGGLELEALVYNRDFIDKNFEQSSELKGVFTLGEKNSDTLKKIADAKNEVDKLTSEMQALKANLEGPDGTSGKKGELATLEEEFEKKCWVQKRKHDEKLKGAFKGYRDNAGKFKGKILQEAASNSSALKGLNELEKRAEVIFGPEPTREASVPSIEATALIAHESNVILGKKIIGKEDVNIAAMIQKLGNSDWVKEGRSFYAVNDDICPFCQQKAPLDLEKSFNEFFDEQFERDNKTISTLESDYRSDAARIQRQLEPIVATASKYLDVDKLKIEKELLDSKITSNLQTIVRKRKEPSQSVEFEPIESVVSAITSIIAAANASITDHNSTVDNLKFERKKLTDEVWKYLLETELKVDIDVYGKKKEALEKAISGMDGKISDAKLRRAEKEKEIRTLEKSTTSVQPTIDGINDLLSSFGFMSFSLAKASSGKAYKLVRQDGADAKETLSEGERTFITFLYFYHLLKGSTSESGITTDRVVVFDDPVSSLDSDILFIVSSLIKGLFDDVRKGRGHIKQIFVLTHNVYFHKEVTFSRDRRKDKVKKDETFWVVRKPGMESRIESHDSNPIKTSYQLLWDEVKRADRSNLAIQNTLRRILEHYFKILGNISFDEICGKFSGKDKLICNSLFSWVNDGSHSAHDEVFFSIADAEVEIYLRVFEEIFRKSGHGAHYDMMMGDNNAEPAKETA